MFTLLSKWEKGVYSHIHIIYIIYFIIFVCVFGYIYVWTQNFKENISYDKSNGYWLVWLQVTFNVHFLTFLYFTNIL